MYNKKNSVTKFSVMFYFANKKALGKKQNLKFDMGLNCIWLDFQTETVVYMSEYLIKSGIRWCY